MGHTVLLEGITTDPKKLKTVWEWPTLRNKQEIRNLLGLCTYYRWFISGLPDISKPLTKLIEERQAFQCTPEVEAIFQLLKNRSCGT
jgi:hypothetical protein